MSNKLKIKVCGMKFAENRREVEQLGVDLLGFIFYDKSKRFIGDTPDPGLFQTTKSKVGVFVNENVFEILGLAKNLGLEYVQLHGKENPKTCEIIKNQGIKVIKAFGTDEKFDFTTTHAYEGVADYFLFDTKTKSHGGSGQKFNWKVLDSYKGETPFFLSGGIGPGDETEICRFEHPGFSGIDLNSAFEDKPGQKNITKLKNFIEKLRERNGGTKGHE